MLFIWSWEQYKTEYQTLEIHVLMLYHWATESSIYSKLQFSVAQ